MTDALAQGPTRDDAKDGEAKINHGDGASARGRVPHGDSRNDSQQPIVLALHLPDSLVNGEGAVVLSGHSTTGKARTICPAACVTSEEVLSQHSNLGSPTSVNSRARPEG